MLVITTPAIMHGMIACFGQTPKVCSQTEVGLSFRNLKLLSKKLDLFFRGNLGFQRLEFCCIGL